MEFTAAMTSIIKRWMEGTLDFLLAIIFGIKLSACAQEWAVSAS